MYAKTARVQNDRNQRAAPRTLWVVHATGQSTAASTMRGSTHAVAARGFMAPGVKDHIRRPPPSPHRLLIRDTPLVSQDL